MSVDFRSNTEQFLDSPSQTYPYLQYHIIQNVKSRTKDREIEKAEQSSHSIRI